MPDLDAYLEGKLSLAEFELGAEHTVRVGEILREASDLAYLKHEQTKGLLTPEAIADQARREAIGRSAAAADALNGPPQMTVTGGPNPPATAPQGGRASPGCIRGLHRFGQLRGPMGEAECLDCQTVFIAPPA